MLVSMASAGRQDSSVGTANLGVLVLSVALAIFVFWRDTPTKATVRPSPLSAVPAGTQLLVTVDVRRLREAELGRALTSGGRELPGLGSLDQICGFDPTTRVTQLVFAMPKLGGRDVELGMAAGGGFSARRITDCASRVIRRRSGRPVESQVGSFATVRDIERSEGELAVKDGGPVLLAGGSFLRRMIDAADGHVRDVRKDEIHTALRQSVGEGAVVASAVLDEGWLVRLTDDRLAALSPLASVRAAALRVRVGSRTDIELVMGCADEVSCDDIASGLAGLRDGFGVRVDLLVGVPISRRLQISQAPGEVRTKLVLDGTETERLVGRLLPDLTDAHEEPDR